MFPFLCLFSPSAEMKTDAIRLIIWLTEMQTAVRVSIDERVSDIIQRCLKWYLTVKKVDKPARSAVLSCLQYLICCYFSTTCCCHTDAAAATTPNNNKMMKSKKRLPTPRLNPNPRSGLFPLMLEVSSLTAADEWFKLAHTSEYVLSCFL